MARSMIVLEKQPWEERLLDMSFDGQFSDDAVTLASASVASIANLDGGAVSLVSGAVAWSGVSAQAMFSGGATGDRYLITWRGIGSNGEKVEMEGVLVVVEAA